MSKCLWKFRGRVHEDVVFSLNEAKANWVATNLRVTHHGYTNEKLWRKKNLRNYKLLLLDIKEPTAHSLTYFHLVNCLLIIGGKDNMFKAVQYIDECFEKLKLTKNDPLTPKMWVARGMACYAAGQIEAAKQSYQKSYDEWQYPEAAVQLGKLALDAKDYNKVIEILIPVYESGSFKLTGIPFDHVQVLCMMLEQLGTAYLQKAMNKEGDIIEYLKKAEEFYRQRLRITQRPNIQVADWLCNILRRTNRSNEAMVITVNLVNDDPGYFVGWNNLASAEIQCQRYRTARIFLKECLRIAPCYQPALKNIQMVETVLNPRTRWIKEG